jgi:hypothetical protein
MPVFRLQLQNPTNWALWVAELKLDLSVKGPEYWQILSSKLEKPSEKKSDPYKEWKRKNTYLMETMGSRIDRDLLYHLKQTNNAADAFAHLRILCVDSTPHTDDMDSHISSVFYQPWIKLEYCIGQAPQDFVYAWNLLSKEVEGKLAIGGQAQFEQFIVAVSAHPSSAHWLRYLHDDPPYILEVTDSFLCDFVEFERKRLSRQGQLLRGKNRKGKKGDDKV